MKKILFILAIALMAGGAQALLPDPLVHYTFDVDFSDSGVLGYDGVPVNEAAIQSTHVKIGAGAIEFDGINDYMSMPNVEGNPTINAGLWEMPEVTVAGWIRLESTWQGAGWVADQILATKWSASSTTLHLAHVENAPRINAWWSSGGVDGFGVPTEYPSGWYHFAFTRDTLKARIYINGVETGSADAVGILTTLSGWGSTVGAGSDGTGQFLDGQLDDLQIYNVALDRDQILEVMPEPATIMLLGLGFGFAARRRKK